jgi:hypothetical protein
MSSYFSNDSRRLIALCWRPLEILGLGQQDDCPQIGGLRGFNGYPLVLRVARRTASSSYSVL